MTGAHLALSDAFESVYDEGFFGRTPAVYCVERGGAAMVQAGRAGEDADAVPS